MKGPVAFAFASSLEGLVLKTPAFESLYDGQFTFINSVDKTKFLHHLHQLFTDRTDRFVKFWLKETLGSSWHWYRYEYAVQRGSIHCHGVAKLKNDPGLCRLTVTALKGFLAAKHKETGK